MVIRTPSDLEDGEDGVGIEDEGIPCGVDVMMTGVLMYGEGPHSTKKIM